jgi:hypothetical protein
MNQQKWLTDKLDRAMRLDKGAIIEITMLECLRHFVEEEKGLVNPADLSDEVERGYLSADELAVLQERYDDLSSAYECVSSKYNLFQELEGKDDALAKIWKHYQAM